VNELELIAFIFVEFYTFQNKKILVFAEIFAIIDD